MNYQFDKKSTDPHYIQLYIMLRNDIVNGTYTYGTKLPSKRIIAEETMTSVITVEHALSLLSDEGYIESRERSGNFVIYKEKDFLGDVGKKWDEKNWKMSSFNNSRHNQTGNVAGDFYSNIDDGKEKQYEVGVTKDAQQENILSETKSQTFQYPVIAKTMRRVLSFYGEEILEKSPSFGDIALREEISKYLKRSRGMKANFDQIIVGSGAEYLYGLIAQFFEKKYIFALEDPSYDIIEKVYTANGIKCELLKLGKDGIKTSELARTKAKVLHITPFNSYPSGITAGASKKNEYLRWAEERKGYIIEDNYDSELTVSRKMEDTIFSMSEDENVIYINTFSNTIASSVRIGYMILPKGMLKEFTEKLGFYSCTVPVFEQYVLRELIKSGDFERHINRIRRKKRKEL